MGCDWQWYPRGLFCPVSDASSECPSFHCRCLHRDLNLIPITPNINASVKTLSSDEYFLNL